MVRPFSSLRYLEVMLRSGILLVVLSFTALAAPPTVAEATKFIEDAEARLLSLNIDDQRADWVKSTFITDDTEIIAAQADEKAIAAQVDFVKQAHALRYA